MTVDLGKIRNEYVRAGLSEDDLDPSPVLQMRRWVEEAVSAGHPEPTAMTLATATPDGQPSARIVLLKDLDDAGLVFFTNYESEKGKALAQNPKASASFFWVMLERQVRVTGNVTRVSREQSEAYFRTRPREAQIGAWASPQSEVLASREALAARVSQAAARFGSDDVPCPPHWGGFRLAPHTWEFWQGRASRLHDRLRYVTKDNAWRIERLAP